MAALKKGDRMAEKYAGIPQSTLSTWGHRENSINSLKLPSGKSFRVIDILSSDGNTYSVVEASDWFAVAVDGYELPNGEFRVGIAGAGEALGYNKNWLGRAMDRGGNTLKTLQGLGFTEKTEKLVTNSGRLPETISLRDFNRLMVYAVQDGKKAALAQWCEPPDQRR